MEGGQEKLQVAVAVQVSGGEALSRALGWTSNAVKPPARDLAELRPAGRAPCEVAEALLLRLEPGDVCQILGVPGRVPPGERSGVEERAETGRHGPLIPSQLSSNKLPATQSSKPGALRKLPPPTVA